MFNHLYLDYGKTLIFGALEPMISKKKFALNQENLLNSPLLVVWLQQDYMLTRTKMNIITGLFQLVSSTVINSYIVNSEIETEFSKRKMELNALVEKCLNWREEFDKDFKVYFC